MLAKAPSYQIIDGADAEEEDPLAIHLKTISTLKRSKRRSDATAVVLAVIALVQALWIWHASRTNTHGSPTYRTDFSDARSAADTIEQDFGGWVWDEESGYIKRRIDWAKPQYFGDPNVVTDLEDNWHKLLEVQFFALSPHEAQAYPDLSPLTGFGNKYMELDVTHKLHCVNHLRKLLYRKYYDQMVHPLQSVYAPEGFYLEHMDHCLENLFQGVICHSDLTPAPLRSFIPDTLNATFSVSGTHTCRNFEDVRKWLYERARQRPTISADGSIYEPVEE